MFEIPTSCTEKIQNFENKHIHVVMIATKPDIIKQAPIYRELKKRHEQVLLIHTGQHYDYNLSGAMLEEFGLDVDINLNIDGSYHQKVAQVISRLGDVFQQIKALGKTPVPYVHGDTMTAMAASNAAWCNQTGCVHVEAGIRTLGLKKDIYKQFINKDIDFDTYYNYHLDRENYEGGQIEPYPEQFNTRCTEPATGLFLAPVELSKENLINEGFRKDRIVVVGNSVVDATEDAMQKAQNSTIFEQHPQLQNGFIRFCIHRRENCDNKERFCAIFEAMETIVNEGHTVLLISLFGTESAIDKFNLRDRLEALKEKNNFVYSSVWPFYSDVIAAMQKCTVCATDSGSMQEEMNYMGIPTVTLRFGTDRPESCIAGGNVLAPLTDGDTISRIITGAINSKEMKKVKNIYGNNVSQKYVEEVLKVLNNGEEMFEFYRM